MLNRGLREGEQVWQEMCRSGAALALFEDKIDVVTHFLGDYSLVAGGWVRLVRMLTHADVC